MVNGTVIHADGTTTPAVLDDLRTRCQGPDFFWLDLDGLDAEASDLLLHSYGLHPLAVEDAEHFGQRPKLDDYDTFTYVVVHGAQAEDPCNTVEVHLFYSSGRLVTVHHGQRELMEQAWRRFARHRVHELSPPETSALYVVVDTLIDSFFPVLATFDDRIDDLEDEILKAPSDGQLGELFDMKRVLVTLRKVVTPQRDLFASLLSGVTALPGMTPEDERYFRDLYDHLIRISDLVDSYRDLLTGAMDTHISTVSNRLNVVMKQLAIIATVFLPLSFLTGFFGQNFGVLVNHYLVHTWTFWGLGIGLEVVAVIVLMVLFRRRGWLGGPTT
jgi:magnesium transporter